MDGATRAATERAARLSYGRLVAWLSARSRDVAGAEDALAEAFRAALETWPLRGVPDHPEAWLLTVARRARIQAGRRAVRHDGAVAELRHLAAGEDAMPELPDGDAFPDERLKLMFVCAHPAIDPAARTPLMLQAVLGQDAARIAAAFLVPPATMGQRLVRAKAKIRDAGIAFAVPGREDWPERLEAVLEAVYAAYGSSWEDLAGADARRRGLAAEAIDLARTLVDLLPGEPEPMGLLALLLHCEARQPARRGPDGRFMPLAEQDTALWSRPLAAEAERLLSSAAARFRPGRFQTEAAIQSVHAQRARTGTVNTAALATLYDVLAGFCPSAGVLVGRAAALGEHAGPAAGLAALDALGPEAESYQPSWAVRAHLLARAGDADGARTAYARAAALTADPSVRTFLESRAAG